MDEPRTPAQVTHIKSCPNIVKEIENLEHYYNAKVQAGGSTIIPHNLAVHFGSKSVAQTPTNCDSDIPNYEALIFSDTSVIEIEED